MGLAARLHKDIIMYSPDLTLGTSTYSLQAQRTNSSVRSDASQPLSEPNTLTISHEVAKNGMRSSVIILDDIKVVSPDGIKNVSADRLRTMAKFQYNPLGGRLAIEADIKAQIVELTAFLADDANITKLLNMES